MKGGGMMRPVLLAAAAVAFGLTATFARAQSGYLAEPPKQSLMTSGVGVVPVFGPGGEQVGDVEDVILGFDGDVVAVIVGLGGFLGLAERLIAVPAERITFSQGDKQPRADLVDTRDVLEAAPTFQPKKK